MFSKNKEAKTGSQRLSTWPGGEKKPLPSSKKNAVSSQQSRDGVYKNSIQKGVLWLK